MPEKIHPPGGRKTALTGLGALIVGANFTGSALIFAVMALIGLDVAGRNLLGQPISGVPEIVALSIAVIVFLQTPAALAANRLTRSDTFISMLQLKAPFLAKIVETIFDALGLIVFGIVAYGTWPLLQKAWTRGEFKGAIGDFTAPVWPVKVAIIIGSTLLVLQFAARIINRWRATDDTI